jgi:hypothetical protein
MFDNLPIEILSKIIYYINNDVDIKNFLTCNKSLYKVFSILFSYKVLEKSNIKNLIVLAKEYYDIKEVDKKTYPNVKSYMFSNSFKNNGYFFICKIYLDELIGCKYLPSEGYIKIYLGSLIEDNIYSAKIKYKKCNKKPKNNYILKKGRKYILINKGYCLPFSHMRNLYIEKNLTILAINNDPIVDNNEKFSHKYLFGFQTYYENDPIQIINEIDNQKSNDWIAIATFNPNYIFQKKDISKEMITFIIKESDIKKLNFNNVFAIYNTKSD